MPQKNVRCFEPNDLPQAKIPEFDRQLAGQERGLNQMTVADYLKGRKAFDDGISVRDPKVAREARASYRAMLEDDFKDALKAQGMTERQAEKKAAEMAASQMSTLAALHNPDMKAAGLDFPTDMGDRNVNSRIGPQWNSRVDDLDAAARRVPASERSSTLMNAKLERCK